MKTRLMALYAIILALTFLSFAPFFLWVFFIPMIAVCATFRFRTGIFATACAAVVSFIYMWIGGDLVALGFQNQPWIPIVPRLITGVVAWWIGHGARKLFGNRKNRFVSKVLPVCVVATTASVLNTILVVGSLVLFAADALGMSGTAFVLYIIPVYAIPELIITNIVCPPLSLSLRKGLKNTELEKEIVPLNGVVLDVISN